MLLVLLQRIGHCPPGAGFRLQPRQEVFHGDAEDFRDAERDVGGGDAVALDVRGKACERKVRAKPEKMKKSSKSP